MRKIYFEMTSVIKKKKSYNDNDERRGTTNPSNYWRREKTNHQEQHHVVIDRQFDKKIPGSVLVDDKINQTFVDGVWWWWWWWWYDDDVEEYDGLRWLQRTTFLQLEWKRWQLDMHHSSFCSISSSSSSSLLSFGMKYSILHSLSDIVSSSSDVFFRRLYVACLLSCCCSHVHLSFMSFRPPTQRRFVVVDCTKLWCILAVHSIVHLLLSADDVSLSSCSSCSSSWFVSSVSSLFSSSCCLFPFVWSRCSRCCCCCCCCFQCWKDEHGTVSNHEPELIWKYMITRDIGVRGQTSNRIQMRDPTTKN